MSKLRFHENYQRTHAIKLGSDRQFGFLFGALFFILSVAPTTFHFYLRLVFGLAALLFLAVALVEPQHLNPLNKAWARFGFYIGLVVSPIILGLLYFGVFTPWGLLLRLFRYDLLNLKTDSKKQSYWIKSSSDKTGTMEQQF